jgi:ribosomal protein S18 acetylase RimI-like enzyme
MRTEIIHDRAAIAAFLRHNADLRAYELGDLDDFFWPATTWYGLVDSQRAIRELFLAYNGGDLLVLLAQVAESPKNARTLLRSILHLLPRRVYSHLAPELVDIMAGDYRHAESHGPHAKMALAEPARLDLIDTTDVVQLKTDELAEIRAFYDASYPGNWFDPRMLETGHYYGYRRAGELLCVSGVHVYAPLQGVAALGNITTSPDARGQGLATQVTARLCKELLRTVDRIGLNVRSDNGAAIACYSRLGFVKVGEYEEVLFSS